MVRALRISRSTQLIPGVKYRRAGAGHPGHERQYRGKRSASKDRRLGGPAALTVFWRSIGDKTSQLDRLEPELNDVPPGTTLDTTTPQAMAHTVASLLHGDALRPESRTKLRAWMSSVQTGSKRIRAGLPDDWVSGDKTGTGIGKTKHTYVDLAFGGPAGRSPLIITAYFEPARLVEPMDPLSLGVLAKVGRLAQLTLTRQESTSSPPSAGASSL